MLFTPGPVILIPEVKKSLALPMWHHRSSEFKELVKGLSLGLKRIFQTQSPVLILNSSGTGAMEAALSNTLSPGDEVICVCAGKFGERWRDIAENFGMKVHSIEVPLGQSVSLSAVERTLEKHKKARAFLITACETSTATEHPIKEISKLLKDFPETLFIVDGVTGVGAMDLPMDLWGIDVLIAGSQKSFMLPTGLSFIALSKKSWDFNKKSSCPKYYFDLKKEKTAQEQGQTAFSSSVSLIRALKESLRYMERQSLKACILRCRLLKESTHSFCRALGLALYSSSPSNAVTAFQVPEGLSGKELKGLLQTNHQIALAGGQGVLKDKILRIGHLGPISNSLHRTALKAIAFELNKKDPSFFSKERIKKALRQAEKVLANNQTGK